MLDREWSEVRLGDLITIKHGWPFKSEYFTEFQDGQPIVVNIGNFRYTGGFRFNSTTLKGYAGNYPKEYELESGDILLVMTCQTAGGEILGIPGRISNDARVYLHNQRLGKVVVKGLTQIDQTYLYWLFLSPSFNRHLVVTASGTKILHTSPNRIEEYRFHLPPLSEQQAIGHILGTLDDKITLNRQMNETLEAIARTLFKSWFVDFDPVRAKMEGRQPFGMSEETAALFPDAFEDSVLGEIPKGWRVGNIADIAFLNRDGVEPNSYPDEIFEHYSIPAFDDGCSPRAEAGRQIKSNKFLVPSNTVLLSKINPTIPRIRFPPVNDLSVAPSVLQNSLLYCLREISHQNICIHFSVQPTFVRCLLLLLQVLLIAINELSLKISLLCKV